MGEYFGITALAGLGVTLFLGGWQAPCAFLQFIPGYVWFGAKLVAVLFLFIWVRATLLRLRIDQLMKFAWKFLIPLALINLAAAAFWLLTPGWTGPLFLAVRWLVALAIVGVPYVHIARRLGAGLGPRTYRYA
jgi:NADH-quinone oxidoreductase subunit H